MGDSAASAQLHGMTQRANVDHMGFSSLWRGADDIKCLRIVDSGYVWEDRVTRASASRNNNPTVAEWSRQVSTLLCWLHILAEKCNLLHAQYNSMDIGNT